jgi:hypothetical protein
MQTSQELKRRSYAVSRACPRAAFPLRHRVPYRRSNWIAPSGARGELVFDSAMACRPSAMLPAGRAGSWELTGYKCGYALTAAAAGTNRDAASKAGRGRVTLVLGSRATRTGTLLLTVFVWTVPV